MITLLITIRKIKCIRICISKKKGQDRNPARFKIQYPMKNQSECMMPHSNGLEKISKRLI